MNDEVISEKKVKISKATRDIFFIDDDEEELEIFELAMQEIKIPVQLHYFKSGDIFFKSLDQRIPDLIFLDLHMPGKSGITILKMLRYKELYNSIPIIIYSKLSNISFIDDCYQAKANYYLIKPVSVKKLTKALSKIIQLDWDASSYPTRENFIIEE